MSEIDNIPKGGYIKVHRTEEQSPMISLRFSPSAENMELKLKSAPWYLTDSNCE